MSHLNDRKIQELEKRANDIRRSIIEMLIEAGSGHTAGPLGMADIFTLFYFHILKHNPNKPNWGERDRVVLSNGHICPVLYATMAHVGYFSIEELKSLRKFGSRLQGHPDRSKMPELETSSGPLGSGLSQALGMALADRIDRGKTSGRFFYCFMSDGEFDEGQTWEAILMGGKEKLPNLIAIIDRNNIQIDGYTERVMPLEPLKEKLESFNWHVVEADGHNFKSINQAVGEAQAVFESPSVIIAHTIPGKGIGFMERRPEWHGAPPGKGPEDVISRDKQGEEALKILRTLNNRIIGDHE